MNNSFYFGDNLHIMRDYIADETVDLIYLDPPFNSNATYNRAPRFLTACAVLWPVRRLEEHMTCLGRVWRVGFAGFTGGGLRRLSALGG